MIVQNKTKIHLMVVVFFMATVAVAGCNNGEADKTTTKETTTKTPTVIEHPRDSMDTGEKAPIVDPK